MALIALCLLGGGLFMFGVAILIDLRARKHPKVVVKTDTVEDRNRTYGGQ